MEAAVVKRKPQMRAAVLDGLNRFQLVDAMETDEKKGSIRLVRLASISSAQLASVRRTTRKLKFHWTGRNWLLRMNFGLNAPKIVFSVDQTEMIGIIQLLGMPVHLKIGEYWERLENVDWEGLQQTEQYVNSLTVYKYYDSLEFSAFISSVSSQLKMLSSTWSVLAQLPPLDLKRARLYEPFGDFNELNRHKIHRLEVPAHFLYYHLKLKTNQGIFSSIKSLGIVHIRDSADFPYDSIEAFSRRFPSLEDLHIVCEYREDVWVLKDYFTVLWAKCLEIRDRLHALSLKRLFLTIKHDCTFQGTKSDWFEKLKLVQPFDNATSTVDRSNECVRMFLKHNEPRGPKPTFFHIKGDFFWFNEDENTDADSSALSGDEQENEAEEDQLDDSSENAMKESKASDQDGMNDAGIY
ncbi:hypothetical protein M3Y99_01369000 [Aphelenchoides fujianensis]|nr:hypothetical protein M3Y99_01369000 [Aphelenchoides fujianensis]